MYIYDKYTFNVTNITNINTKYFFHHAYQIMQILHKTKKMFCPLPHVRDSNGCPGAIP